MRPQKIWENKRSKLIICLFCFLILRKVLDKLYRKLYHLPPGPIGLPLFGSYFEFMFNQRNFLHNLGLKYNQVSMVYFFNQKIIFVNDFDLLKQHFNKKEFINRFDKTRKNVSFVNESGNLKWYKRRQLLHKTVLKQLNSNKMDHFIRQCLKKVIFPKLDKISNDNNNNNNNKNNNTWDIRNDANYISFILLYIIIFGEPLNLTDKSFKLFVELNTKLFHLLRYIMPIRPFIPSFLRNYINNISIFYKFRSIAIKRRQIIKGWIDQYNKNNINCNVNEMNVNVGRKYYETLQNEIEIQSNFNESEKYLNDESMIADIALTFGNGIQSPATVLERCILYLAYFGIEYQDTLFNEIINNCQINDQFDKSIDFIDNFDILKNKSKLHRFNSFIYEILRLQFGTSAASLDRLIIDENVYINKYLIPKGSIIYGNLYHINTNKDYWQNDLNKSTISPLKIDNNRFINSDSKLFIHDLKIATFGLGKRNCVGEKFSMQEIILIMALLILSYKFYIPTTFINKEKFESKIPIDFIPQNTPKLGVIIEKRNDICQ